MSICEVPDERSLMAAARFLRAAPLVAPWRLTWRTLPSQSRYRVTALYTPWVPDRSGQFPRCRVGLVYPSSDAIAVRHKKGRKTLPKVDQEQPSRSRSFALKLGKYGR